MFFKTVVTTLSTALLCVCAKVSMAEVTSQRTWTLETSVQQAANVSPELKISSTEIGSYEADMKMSGLWPDPSIEFRVDNKLGKDDRSGGVDLTDVTISQAIPFSRMKHQKSVAQSNLASVKFQQKYKALLVQTRVSKVFHELQLASAELKLMKQRLAFADDLNVKTKKSSQGVVVRYLTPLEKMRLSVIREEANQAVSNAEGKYQEALNEFSKLLGIEVIENIQVEGLQRIKQLPDLMFLYEYQENHPQLLTQMMLLQSATSEIEVARNSQLEDPVVSLSRSQDSFDSGRDDVYALMLNIQIPLQDRKDTAVSKASYKASEQRIEFQRLKRELEINLKRSYTHANHILEQAESYEKKVLKPANDILKLTKKGFTSGELNMLSLVDATNTYFDSRFNYLDLLSQAHNELADIRLYAGQLLVKDAVQLNEINKGAH